MLPTLLSKSPFIQKPGIFSSLLIKQFLNFSSFSLTIVVIHGTRLAIQGAQLAKNSILSYKSILHSALNYAVYPAEFISVNPASLVKIPNNVATNIVERKIISPETYKKIINDKQLNPAERLVAIIAYHTGMRIAEILGLTWECIDLDKGLIKVAYQVIRYKGQRYFTSKLKRLSSYRDIYIDQDLVDLLKMWHDKQLKYTSPFSIINYVEGIPGQIHIQTQKYLPENVIPVHFVCLSNKGKLVSYSNVAGKLKKNII